MTHKSYVTIGDADDVPVTVHYTAHAFCAGSTDGRHGPKIEPDEPAWIEIDDVIDADGHPVFVSEEQEEALQLEIAEALDERDDDDGRDIRAIGNFLKDDWFCPKLEWKEQP